MCSMLCKDWNIIFTLLKQFLFELQVLFFIISKIKKEANIKQEY